MALSFFPVVGALKAAITDTSTDVGGDPDVKAISATLVFTAKPHRVREEGVVYEITPLRCRTDLTTGEIETIDGSAVSLVDSVGLDVDAIEYTLTFEDVVVPGQHGALTDLMPMVFMAPGDGSEVDLGTVVP